MFLVRLVRVIHVRKHFIECCIYCVVYNVQVLGHHYRLRGVVDVKGNFYTIGVNSTVSWIFIFRYTVHLDIFSVECQKQS